MKSATAEWLFHHPRVNHPNEWLTPRWILNSLGEFDLDPASPVDRPWSTARTHYTRADNGLTKPWFGRVWLNPPYGSEIAPFMARLAGHGRGTALVFTRTDSVWFQDSVFNAATALFFFKGRPRFHLPNGARSSSTGGAPSVLAAYGEEDARALRAAGFSGTFIRIGQSG